MKIALIVEVPGGENFQGYVFDQLTERAATHTTITVPITGAQVELTLHSIEGVDE